MTRNLELPDLSGDEIRILETGTLGSEINWSPRQTQPAIAFYRANILSLKNFEIENDEFMFAPEHEFPREEILFHMIPLMNLVYLPEMPEMIRKMIPFHLMSWAYANWWREKIPRGLFSRRKRKGLPTGSGVSPFDILPRGTREGWTFLRDEFSSVDKGQIIPRWVLDGLAMPPDSDFGVTPQGAVSEGSLEGVVTRLYRWMNTVQNFIHRLPDKEFEIYRSAWNADGPFLPTLLTSALEKDLVRSGILKKLPRGANRSQQSYDRFRSHDSLSPRTVLGKLVSNNPSILEKWREFGGEPRAYPNLPRKEKHRRKELRKKGQK